MADVAKLLYIVVMDEDDNKTEKMSKESFRYTRSVLQSTLQLMGCKARHAFKISKRVFDTMRRECLGDAFLLTETDSLDLDSLTRKTEEDCNCSSGYLGENNKPVDLEKDVRNKRVPFELYKRRTTVVVKRETFLDVVCEALAEYKYLGPKQRSDLILACRVREKKESVTILLCGTSGCGKSTLSALLASRLGITTVVSTDSIRHMMRSFVDEKDNPLLWSSTYHAGEYLDPVAVAEAKAKRKAKKLSGVIHSMSKEDIVNSYKGGKSESGLSETSTATDLITPKQMAIEGFKAQSEMVIDSLDRLITAWEERKESVVVEGVHLSLNFVMGLMKKHPSIIPFMIFITQESKHLERFAVRAKYMTLDPAKNKYVKYIKNIRTIQEYLCKGADKHYVPKVNNSNVDKSVAAIHATVFGCLRRRDAGEQLYDDTKKTVALVNEEYKNQCDANSMSSKGMFQLIQRKGSSRHLMALFNTDGSVAKAWPVNSINNKGKSIESGVGAPMYGPLLIDKAEPVNLQFGPFGLSAWPTDIGCTSRAGSVDGSRGDGTENGSRYFSSCCSSPKMSDGPSKELMEDHSFSGSEEEVDGPPDVDSDDDLSNADDKKMDDEGEGSVDEESTKSDEEYDDLAMQDLQENEYPADIDNDEEGQEDNWDPIPDEKYKQNLEQFIKSAEDLLPDDTPSTSNHVHSLQNGTKVASSTSHVRTRKQSQSIPAFREHGTAFNSLIISGAREGMMM
uniref:Uncharacterized protein n=1 Tax=Kalanchoe fedtschenkoi TaxID=63787 RepID=A0A7N0VBY7_KALFE